jgi:tetratricopeptide (TPR) repeat protein
VQILLARALAGAKQIEEAKSLARSVRSADPILLFEVGTVLLECGEYQEAIARFSAARESYPLRAVLEYNLALAYFRAKDFQAAGIILERLAETREADAGTYTLLADTYRRQGKSALAFNLLRQATATMPRSEQLFLDLLALCVELVTIDQGLQIAGTALQHHPASSEAFGLRAQLYSLKGEPKLAEADYRAAILLSPKTEWLHLGLAMSLMLDNRLEEARAILEEQVRRSSGYYSYYLYSEVLNIIGLESSGLLRPKVRQLLERAVSLNPDFAPSRINLGRLYADDQDWERAIEQFRAAIASDPGDKRPYYDLARIYQRRGDLEQAQALLSQVRKFNEAEQSQTPEQLVVQRFRELRQSALRDRER